MHALSGVPHLLGLYCLVFFIRSAFACCRAEFEGYSEDETVRVVMSGNQEPKSVEITETAIEQGSDVSISCILCCVCRVLPLGTQACQCWLVHGIVPYWVLLCCRSSQR